MSPLAGIRLAGLKHRVTLGTGPTLARVAGTTQQAETWGTQTQGLRCAILTRRVRSEAVPGGRAQRSDHVIKWPPGTETQAGDLVKVTGGPSFIGAYFRAEWVNPVQDHHVEMFAYRDDAAETEDPLE